MYEINMSKGVNIKIDSEDLQKIQDNLKAPLIRVKQAIINPSFMVSIVPIEQKEFIEKPKFEIQNGVAKIIGEEKIRTLEDKMNLNKLLS